MRQASLLAAFVLIGALGGVAPILAQDSEPRPSLTNSTDNSYDGETPAEEPSTDYDDSIVVTASTLEQEVGDLPASATVINSAEILARQAVSIGELIATAPGVAVVASGPPGQVTSTFVRGAESDQVLLLWNGVELNNPYFGSINWAFLPADGVERVEVVRGPFSSLHGGNAVGGVVQILTGDHDGGQLRLEGGSDSYSRAGLAAGHSFGNWRIDFTGHSRRGDSELENGFFDSDELVAHLAWTPSAGVEVGLLARANDSTSGIPLSGGQPSLERVIDWSERQIVIPVRIEKGDWKIDSQLSQVDFESAFRDPQDPFGFTRSDTDSQAQRIRTQAAWQPNSQLGLAFGGEIERLEVTDSSTFGSTVSSNLDAADQRTWALFSELSWKVGAWTLDLGARRDDNDAFGAETSLRAGLGVRLGDGWRLWTNYGEAFRPPTLGELFFPFSGNPELQPERAESFELGSQWRWAEAPGGDWRLSLVAFQNRQRDLIDFDFVTFTNINVGRARSRGVEASLDVDGPRLDLRTNITYLDAEDRDTGLALLRRPEWSANLVASLAASEEWRITLTGRFVDDRPDVDPVTFTRAENSSYLRFDLAAQWQASQRFAPYARVENIADEEYAEALGFPAPGRTLIGGIAVSF